MKAKNQNSKIQKIISPYKNFKKTKINQQNQNKQTFSKKKAYYSDTLNIKAKNKKTQKLKYSANTMQTTTPYSQKEDHCVSKSNNENLLLKRQQELKRMILKLEKQVNILVKEKSPRNNTKRQVHSPLKLKSPLKRNKRLKTNNNQNSSEKKQNALSTLSCTKSFRSNLSNLASFDLISQNRAIKKKVLSITNSQKNDFIFLNGNFIKANKSLIQNIKLTLHSRQNTSQCIFENKFETFLTHDDNLHNQNQSLLDKEKKCKAIEEYKNKKAIIIQRWWKSILLKKKNLHQNKKIKSLRDSFKNQLFQDLKQELKQQKLVQNHEYQINQIFFKCCPEAIINQNNFQHSFDKKINYQLNNPNFILNKHQDSNSLIIFQLSEITGKNTNTTIAAETIKKIQTILSEQSKQQQLQNQQKIDKLYEKTQTISKQFFQNQQQIKEKSQRQQQQQSLQDNNLTFRQNAAKIRRDTHITILKNIKRKNNIDQQVFQQYLKVIQLNYINQIKQIQKIKDILNQNIDKAQQIIFNVKKNVKQVANVDNIGKNKTKYDDFIHNMFENKQTLKQQTSQSRIISHSNSQFRNYDNHQQILQKQFESQQIESSQQSDYADLPEFTKNNIQQFDKYYMKESNENNSNNCQQSPINSKLNQDYFYQISQIQNNSSSEESIKQDQQEIQINCEQRNQFDFSNSQIVIQLDSTRVQNLINIKVAKQLSMIQKPHNQNVVDTNLNSIIRNLIEFFQYYLSYHKDQFLHFINTPFGQNPKRRLARMQNYQDFYQENQEDLYIYGISDVIRKTYYQEYQKQKLFSRFQSQEENNNQYSRQKCMSYNQNSQSQQDSLDNSRQGSRKQLIKQSQFFHNMATYDALNEAFDQLRPYYQTNGQGYQWNTSQKSLSFYFITQEAINSVFYKAQMKIMKWVSSLCGLIIDQKNTFQDNRPHQFNHSCQNCFQNAITCYKKCTNYVLAEFHEDKQLKMEKFEVKQDNNRLWTNFNEEKTTLLYGIQMILFDQIIQQCSKNILSMKYY